MSSRLPAAEQPRSDACCVCVQRVVALQREDRRLEVVLCSERGLEAAGDFEEGGGGDWMGTGGVAREEKVERGADVDEAAVGRGWGGEGYDGVEEARASV